MSRINLDTTGLMVMGSCALLPEDALPHEGGSITLMGPDEPQFWALFTASPEFSDGQPNPLDRWSKRVIDALAARLGGTAYYPFGGAPFLPFYTWAVRTGAAWASPIGFLVHETAGLFASYRGAIWLPDPATPSTAVQPCLTCDAPCKTACPVDAFALGYDVAACKSYLDTPVGGRCLSQGCQARRACPIGANRRLDAQAAFHMEAFR